MDRTILIIEDDSSQADSLSDLLDLEGYQSIQGRTYAKGLELARETRPPVALLDIKLPDGSGTDLLGEIKEAVPATMGAEHEVPVSVWYWVPKMGVIWPSLLPSLAVRE